MKKFTVEITDTDVYFNGHLHMFGCKTDEESYEDDINKNEILALVDEMGYEPILPFEEVTGRLGEI